KVVMHGGAAFAAFCARVEASVARAQARVALAAHASALAGVLARLREVTRKLWSLGDVVLTLANASVYLEAFGHITVAWIWLEQALAAHGRDGDFYDGKRSATDYFMRWELPKVHLQLDLLESCERTPLDIRAACF
ncbi:MAG: acyl-CoA dehydrogenase C-terminal domain-containing protein, partial [Rudaea sp.]